jgi:hypothetical protein
VCDPPLDPRPNLVALLFDSLGQQWGTDMTEYVLWISTVFTLGIFAGSLLLEGFVLVPFWQSLTPSQFYEFHHNFGARLFGYFAPITAMAALIPLGLAGWVSGANIGANIAAGASLAVLTFFPLYFRAANEAFMKERVSHDDLPEKLRQWANVHTWRTLMALCAFGAALMAH